MSSIERQARRIRQGTTAVVMEITPRRVAAAILGATVLLPTLSATRAAAADGSGDNIVVIDNTKSDSATDPEPKTDVVPTAPSSTNPETTPATQPSNTSEPDVQPPIDRIADVVDALGVQTPDSEKPSETPSAVPSEKTPAETTDPIIADPSEPATATPTPVTPPQEGGSVQTQPDASSAPTESPETKPSEQTPTPTETPVPSQTDTGADETPKFALPKDDQSEKPSVADRISQFFGWGTSESPKPAGTGVTDAMKTTEASLNDEDVVSEFVQSLPTYGETDPVVHNLPGAGAVTRSAGETPEVSASDQEAASNTFGETVNTLVSIVQTPPPASSENPITSGNEKGSDKEADASNPNSDSIRNSAFKERVDDLRQQSKTPISTQELYNLFTNADNKYNHPVINRELLLSMAFRESLLGKLKHPSSAGARGMVQFMKGTWDDWGKGKDIMDNEANIDAAFRYMIHIYKWTGDRFPNASVEERVKLSLAAYNWGPGNINKLGRLPGYGNSARHYAEKIFASAQKTKDYIDKKVTAAKKGNTSNEGETIVTPERVSLPYQDMINGVAKHYKLKAEHGGKTGLLDPSELEKIGDAWGDNKLIPEAAEAFRLMNAAFKEEFGRNISIGNSYRTLQRQKEMAGSMAAPVGASRHGSGIAIDLGEANDDWGEKDREWIQNEGWKYGWVNPLWAQKGASSKFEPWHIEFRGNQAKKDQKEVVKYQLKGHKDGDPVSDKLIEELGISK